MSFQNNKVEKFIDLPNEILLEIFLFLYFPTFRRLLVTCKKINEILQQPPFFKGLLETFGIPRKYITPNINIGKGALDSIQRLICMNLNNIMAIKPLISTDIISSSNISSTFDNRPTNYIHFNNYLMSRYSIPLTDPRISDPKTLQSNIIKKCDLFCMTKVFHEGVTLGVPAEEFLYYLADAYALSENIENKERLKNDLKALCQKTKWTQQATNKLKLKKIPEILRPLVVKTILSSKYNISAEKIPGMLLMIKLPANISHLHNMLNSIQLLKFTPINKRYELFKNYIYHSNVTADNFSQFISVMPEKGSPDFYKFIRCFCEKVNKHYDHKNNPNTHSLLLKNIFGNVNKAHHAEIFRYVFSIYMGACMKNEKIFACPNNVNFVINNLLPAINIETRAKALNQTFFCINQNNQKQLYLTINCKAKNIICACIENADNLIKYLELLRTKQPYKCITENIDMREKYKAQNGFLRGYVSTSQKPSLNALKHDKIFQKLIRNEFDLDRIFQKLSLNALILLLSFEKGFGKYLFSRLDLETNNHSSFIKPWEDKLAERIEKEKCDPICFLVSRLKYCLNQNKFTEIKKWLKIFEKNPDNKKIITYFNLLLQLIKLIRPSPLKQKICRTLTDPMPSASFTQIPILWNKFIEDKLIGKIWRIFKRNMLEFLNVFNAETSTDEIKAAKLKFTESLKEFNENFLDNKIHNSANFWKGPISYINAQKTLSKLIKAIDEKHTSYESPLLHNLTI